MDRRTLILLIATCLLLAIWNPLMRRIYPDKPLPPAPTNRLTFTGTNASAIAPTGALGNLTPISPPTVAPVRPGVADSGFRPAKAIPTELTLESPEARYVFTSRGGGIKEIELKQYEDAITWRERRKGQTPGRAVMNRWATTPVMALLRPGDDAEPPFQLGKTNDVVTAQCELGNGWRVVKEFRLQTNQLLRVTTRLQNWSNETRTFPVQEWVIGTAAPLHPAEDAIYLGLFDYDGNSSQHIGSSWFANRTLGCLPGTPRAEYLSAQTNTAWAAVHNQFFATIAIPQDRSAKVFARNIDLVVTNAPPGSPPLGGFQTALVYGADVIPAQQERVREFDLYIGPKEYRAISALGQNADVVMGFDNYFGGRFSGFFARGLLLAMNGLHHGVGLSYGLSIIAITVVVRLLFWPLMRASARTSKRMAALQPQIKELQEKFKDNPQKMNQRMLELWREHKINPASGCLPILIQFPILLGFYAMLQTAIELRGEHFLWASDLSQTDTVAVIPGLDFPLNPLPLFMGITMLWQARLTPMSPSMDPAQQKILKYMPLMFMVFLYNFSAGLTLYWTVSNLLSILQMKLTKAMDEKTTATPVAKPVGVTVPTRKSRTGGKAT